MEIVLCRTLRHTELHLSLSRACRMQHGQGLLHPRTQDQDLRTWTAGRAGRRLFAVPALRSNRRMAPSAHAHEPPVNASHSCAQRAPCFACLGCLPVCPPACMHYVLDRGGEKTGLPCAVGGRAAVAVGGPSWPHQPIDDRRQTTTPRPQAPLLVTRGPALIVARPLAPFLDDEMSNKVGARPALVTRPALRRTDDGSWCKCRYRTSCNGESTRPWPTPFAAKGGPKASVPSVMSSSACLLAQFQRPRCCAAAARQLSGRLL